MHKRVLGLLLGVGLLALLAGSSGCGVSFEFKVLKSLEDKTVEVQVVGVNATEVEDWKKISVAEYFKPGNPLRETAVKEGYAKVLRFGRGLSNPQTVGKDDPIRKVWEKRRAKYLVVLADIPGYTGSEAADLRRIVLPLEDKHWPKSNLGHITVKVEVSPGKVTCLTEYTQP